MDRPGTNASAASESNHVRALIKRIPMGEAVTDWGELEVANEVRSRYPREIDTTSTSYARPFDEWAWRSSESRVRNQVGLSRGVVSSASRSVLEICGARHGNATSSHVRVRTRAARSSPKFSSRQVAEGGTER
jgi:hypothetical protein